MIESKVLIIGSGGREDAIAWKISQSDNVSKIFISPGNAGTRLREKATNIHLPLDEHTFLINWCKDIGIDLVIIGPEGPLAEGLSDLFTLNQIDCFGPSQLAARIETSKEFSKSFMDRHGIPTPRWKSFKNVSEANNYINLICPDEIVIKASGLASGKGVVLTSSKNDAVETVKQMLELKKFGDAGTTILIEEKIVGEEISVFAFSDGTNIASFPPAQDFKRIYNGDLGPNTGGMGAYCSVPHISKEILDFVHNEILQKTVQKLNEEGTPFVGLLYAGIMLTKDGPKVLEFNCRFGDPETQALLPLMKSDLYITMKMCCQGKLDEAMPLFDTLTKSVTVVLASGGYPESYVVGFPIKGLDDVQKLNEVFVFHAGTSLSENTIVTSGGRVLALTGLGDSFKEARSNVYKAVDKIYFDGMVYRKDIALKVLSDLSYLDSGVNIDAGSTLVECISPLAKSTSRTGCVGSLGGFGALFDLKAIGLSDPILVSGTDGVGTKLMIAQKCRDHERVGIDLVAMCVNDILAHGAEPLFFLDYYACGKLICEDAVKVISGISEGCKQAGCALVGGETAEMPGMYKNEEYDIAGFAVGVVERTKLLPKIENIKVGNSVIGLSSSGIHSNGFSLVRKIVDLNGLNFMDKCPFLSEDISLGRALLTPTKIYIKAVLPLIKQELVLAFAHITGGGLLENIPRVLPPEVCCKLDASLWPIPPVFGWLSEMSKIDSNEMMRTFNCGLGAILIVEKKYEDIVLASLNNAGESAYLVGTLSNREKKQVEVEGFEAALQASVLQTSLNKEISRKEFVDGQKHMKVACLISGSGTNLQALLHHSIKRASCAKIVLVISNVPNAEGLYKAQRAGIKTMVIDHKLYKKRIDFDNALLEILKKESIELVCLAGFMRILTGEFVRYWSGRLINIHPSLLPSFKGMDAHKQVLESGVRVTGCTVHFVEEEVDCGGIISQGVVPVEIGDTIEILQDRVKRKEWEIYPLAMEMIASKKVQLVEGKVVFLY
ncbi:trifunctional purine biosynthetic protein adenosine-3 isoform X2 [Hydra vulgaris]|uniref:Trifunctional purine biosynthetic protein adenosine-3 n=1 Tax=Hydra vulgaris TaxID=6087 RepID=A0ABM4BLZ6_HYDVU